MTTTFSLPELLKLRTKAARLTQASEDGPVGWSKSTVDPMKVLAVFKCLRIKDVYILRAYQFREGGNGNGIVWAMPVDAPFPAPDQCPRLPAFFLEPSKPPNALDNMMEAVEGDGTPWSYLCASLLCRELGEFGAMWHGCSWGTHRILGRNPFTGRRSSSGPSGDAADWRWREAEPAEWLPQVTEEGKKVTVTFYTYSGLMPEGIRRFKDTFRRGSYSFKSCRKEIATGRGGYLF